MVLTGKALTSIIRKLTSIKIQVQQSSKSCTKRKQGKNRNQVMPNFRQIIGWMYLLLNKVRIAFQTFRKMEVIVLQSPHIPTFKIIGIKQIKHQ